MEDFVVVSECIYTRKAIVDISKALSDSVINMTEVTTIEEACYYSHARSFVFWVTLENINRIKPIIIYIERCNARAHFLFILERKLSPSHISWLKKSNSQVCSIPIRLDYIFFAIGNFINKRNIFSYFTPTTGKFFINKKETKIMNLLADGLSVVDISKKLDINIKTIYHYQSRLIKLFGVKNRIQLYQVITRYSRIPASLTS
ncbi:helix-turn-helix domain-containing protein [Ewingella americana]|uniref:helix-turn-helix domain-containing protein n=1 Tax=Ewingella americana TaxID=41202 RepID=UPI0012AD66BE|nr:helix-turn-helix transcriptional regulator [Ewingella americana]MRT06080.1 hypothetical protein [Ewingella americana]